MNGNKKIDTFFKLEMCLNSLSADIKKQYLENNKHIDNNEYCMLTTN